MFEVVGTVGCTCMLERLVLHDIKSLQLSLPFVMRSYLAQGLSKSQSNRVNNFFSSFSVFLLRSAWNDG